MDRNQLNRIVSDDIRFPESVELSQNCKDFITKCLEKEQEHRASIVELRSHPFLKDSFQPLSEIEKKLSLC